MRSVSVRLWLFALVAASVLAQPASLRAQAAGQVSGTVTSEAGQPLSGASVTVVGTTLGAFTGADGRYTIGGVQPGQRTVRANMLGYGEQSRQVAVAAGQTASADFRLSAQAIQLEGLVAVGYGTQRKVNLTGAVASVDGEKLAQRPVANVSQALQGVLPGLTVQNNGGSPGRDGADIKIRGIGTIGGHNFSRSNPLILIDGIPGNINYLDADDIESVSVLKDASSAAIYGSRAANGVILVTTKRGKATGGVEFSYHGSYGMQDITAWPERVGIGDYMTLVNEAHVNAGRAPKYSEEYMRKTLSREDPVNYPDTDWFDEFFNPAPIQDHTMRLTGGNDLARFSLSLNVRDQDGMVANSWADLYGLRFNSDFTASDRFSGGIDIAARREHDSEPHNRWQAYFYLIHDTPPTVRARYPDGTYGWSDQRTNPLAWAESSGNRQRRYDHGLLNGRLNYKLAEGLTLRTLGSLQTGNWRYGDFREARQFYDYHEPEKLRMEFGPNALWRTNATDLQTNLRANLDYDRSFGDHSLQGLLGYEQIANDWEEVGASRERFYSNDLRVMNLGDPSTTRNWGRANQWRLRSGFGRLSYNYQGKYLLEGNARYDGSSRFAQGNRYGFFPSFSAGWRLSEEPFMDKVGFISDLKLRGSWGQLGNQEIGLYRYFSTINLGQNYSFGGRLADGAAKTGLANENISWETTTMRNFGVDAEFFDGRLAFTGDIYRKDTDGILLTLPIPQLVGRSAPVQNAGKVRNAGWETQLAWRDAVSDLNYSIGFNLADNRNRVMDLVGTGPYVGWYTATLEGQPINVLWGYKATGLFQSEEEVRNHAKGLHPRTGPGDVRYEDVNGDGMINGEDKVPMGSALPRYEFAANLSAAWRGIDASMSFQGVGKQNSYVILGLAEGPSWGQHLVPLHLDRWTPENRNARAPRPLLFATHNTIPSTWWVMDGKYAKLQNAQLAYTIPSSVAERMGTERLRLYVSGQNLMTWSPMEIGLDPEAPTGVFDYYPQTRLISIGTEIAF